MDYTGSSPSERKSMLEYIGVDSMDELYADVNDKILLKKDLDVEGGYSEVEVHERIVKLASKNNTQSMFTGAGVYNHFVPSAVRHVTGLPEIYTAYTPYQAEVSQGVLQALYEFQTMMCELTGMEVSNASMYDGSTALAEACLMAHRINNKNTVIAPENIHPEYMQVLETYLNTAGIRLETVETQGGVVADNLEEHVTDDTACVIIQNPNFFGCLEDVDAITDIVHDKKSLLISCVIEATSLGIVKPPARSDIVVGEGQCLGNPMSFGGPHFGFMATRMEYVRKMPGRLVGATTDRDGERGFVLTLQAREQHIRREKATSNICTSESLNAIAASSYLALLGPEGFRHVALNSHKNASYLSMKLCELDGFERVYDQPFYNEFLLKCPESVEAGFDVSVFYPDLDGCRLFCCTEVDSREEIDAFVGEVSV
ncbi:MAG: aminomethyl-transferring glycine dehydrogenase subunit GcvPA [Candidatus Altiarchaeota archaeon]